MAAVMLGGSLAILQPGIRGQGTQVQQAGGGQPVEISVAEGQPCPPGTTLARIGRCVAPALPPPSILDYRPKSTLVTQETVVTRAKFPTIDIHSHETATPQNIERLVKEMDALNLRVLVNLSGGSADRLKRNLEVIRSSGHADRFRVFANINFDGAGTPDWSRKVVGQLEQDIRNGAIGLKIFKNLGLNARKADGSRLRVDDPELDPIWETCARMNVPVLIHVADPAQFFEPITYENERWLELGVFPNRAYPPDKFPRFEELMTERDRMFARHRNTRFINAHFGWHGNDLARAGRHLDSLPNVVFEVGAVLYEFGRQPRAAREFFIKYQDRILFGKDA
jgi:predicted TIM-barrel fold metal-dependent hydrolase